MQNTTSRLGIFEVVGFLFSGLVGGGLFLLAVSASIPAWGRYIVSAPDPGILGSAAALAFAYVFGLGTSRMVYLYYRGTTGRVRRLFPAPPNHPFHGDGQIPWQQLESKLNTWNGIALPGCRLRQQRWTENRLHAAAYASPIAGVVDRIASTARFAASVTFTAGASAVWILGTLAVRFTAGNLTAQAAAIAAGVFVALALLMTWGHRTASRYADIYWMYVAQAIVLATSVPPTAGNDQRAGR